MSNEMRDWQADEIQELQGRIKELEAIIAIRNVRIAPEPLDMERWVQLSHCAVLEAEKTSTPDAPRNPDDTLYYWAFQTLAVQESAITDQQARIAELEALYDKAFSGSGGLLHRKELVRMLDERDAQLAELREALQKIADGEQNLGWSPCSYIAKQALRESSDE